MLGRTRGGSGVEVVGVEGGQSGSPRPASPPPGPSLFPSHRRLSPEPLPCSVPHRCCGGAAWPWGGGSCWSEPGEGSSLSPGAMKAFRGLRMSSPKSGKQGCSKRLFHKLSLSQWPQSQQPLSSPVSSSPPQRGGEEPNPPPSKRREETPWAEPPSKPGSLGAAETGPPSGLPDPLKPPITPCCAWELLTPWLFWRIQADCAARPGVQPAALQGSLWLLHTEDLCLVPIPGLGCSFPPRKQQAVCLTGISPENNVSVYSFLVGV